MSTLLSNDSRHKMYRFRDPAAVRGTASEPLGHGYVCRRRDGELVGQ